MLSAFSVIKMFVGKLVYTCICTLFDMYFVDTYGVAFKMQHNPRMTKSGLLGNMGSSFPMAFAEFGNCSPDVLFWGWHVSCQHKHDHEVVHLGARVISLNPLFLVNDMGILLARIVYE